MKLSQNQKIGITIAALVLLGATIYYFTRPKKDEEQKDEKEDKAVKDAYSSLLFETNKDVIKPSSYPALDEVVEVLNSNPDWKLELIGHTDNVGDAEFNLVLSAKRAVSVKKYLVSKGISERRITATGKGMLEPIASNDTEEGRSKNRRVDFNIIKA
jgi:OmpA-OmpF porin, OOP family